MYSTPSVIIAETGSAVGEEGVQAQKINCYIYLTIKSNNLQFSMLVNWGGVGIHVYFQVPTCQFAGHMTKKYILHLFYVHLK